MKLSVMMITYNHEKFIAQALSSILEQRVNFEYEIVVSEDCSTDGTREILMDFQRRYPGCIVPLLRDKNLGAMKNAVETLAACRGEYISFLEGDDYWTDENKLQKQIDFLDTHQGTALCCTRVQVAETNGSHTHPPIPSGTYTIKDLLHWNFVATCSVVLRQNLIGEIPSWISELALADWPIFILVSRHGTIELLDETTAVYRVHPTSIWSSRSDLSRFHEMARMLTILDRHLDYQYTKVIKQTVAQCHLSSAILQRENGNRVDTCTQLVACIRSGGWRLPTRILGGLAAYTLIGRWYKLFSRQTQRASVE